MGLGDTDQPGDGGGAGLAAPVSCSICLEFVVDGGERSTTRLRCGHLFHLDCIGSAFNAKGVMQCPNCREIEKGNWLYSNGHRSIPEFLDEWMHEDDFYGMAYTEMPFGHFCPFSRLAQFPFLYDAEGEYTSSLEYSDLFGRHTIFSEYPGSQFSIESAAIDGPNFHHPWNNIPGPVDVTTSHAFPALDVHRQTWNSRTQPSNHVSGVEQALASTPGAGSDTHPRQMYVPVFVGQESGFGASNLTTAMVTNQIGNSRGQSLREGGYGVHPRTRRVANYLPSARRVGRSRSLASRGPTPQAERSAYFIHRRSPSTRNPQGIESSGGSNRYVLQRGQTNSSSQDFDSLTGLWPQHSLERPPSQPWPPHHPFR